MFIDLKLNSAKRHFRFPMKLVVLQIIGKANLTCYVINLLTIGYLTMFLLHFFQEAFFCLYG